MKIKLYHFLTTLLIVSVLPFFVGCNYKPKGLEPDKLLLHSPVTLVVASNAILTSAIHVELLSKPIAGFMGGKGSSYPVVGATITVVPLEADGKVTAVKDTLVTDAGGACKFDLKVDAFVGDRYLDVICQDAPEIRQRVRVANGIVIENDSQEIKAGEILPKPIQIRLTDTNGAPAIGADVYFSLVRQPGKDGGLSKFYARTDSNGVARTILKTEPKISGTYEVSIEAVDVDHHIHIRPVHVKAMAISPTRTVLGVLGGLAIFIFGMTLLSDGLQQVAGNKLKAALAYITRNRVTGILAGAFLAALVQSSSLTTVMTVGFVNAGLLTLRQAIGVVFGANIGTTVTGQMVSFNISGLAQPAMIIGVVLLIIIRRGAFNGLARAILGFGFLSFGMLLMSTELKAVSVFPSFAAFFSSIDCAPIDGNVSMVAMLGAVGIGTVMTILVQSSAATIGLAIALANSGLLNIWTAIPIVLGDNIGTTITALIAAVSANRTARQTALAHSMFNVLGSAIVLGSFYFTIDGVPSFLFLVNSVTSGDVFAGENVGRHVAMAHSIFNVVNVVIMTPFIGVLAWLCERILPGKSVTERTVQLEMNLLNTPPLALFCAMRALGDMTEIAWKASAIALSSYRDGKIIDVSEVEKLEDEVDEYQTSIMDYMVQLTRKDLTEKQAAAIPVMMHCVNDAERISDLALIIARRSVTQAERCAHFSDDAQQELENLLDKAFAVANLTRESLQDGRFLAKAVEAMVSDLKKMANEATQMHVNRLQKGLCTPERGLIYVEVISVLMHIVRHLENIAQRSDELTEAAT